MKKFIMFIVCMACTLVQMGNVQTATADYELENKYYVIEQPLNDFNKSINTTVDEYVKETIEYKEELNRREKERISKTAEKVSDENPYEGYITKYMDLENRMDITQEDLEKVINHYTEEYPDSELKGQARAYIRASKETGLDPVFLLALSGHESGWYVSELHANRNNPYSIGMWDEDPYRGYYLGDTFSEGIVNGAEWIRENYYDEGECCLYEMIYGDRQYASTEDEWIDNIVEIMDDSYKLINTGGELI